MCTLVHDVRTYFTEREIYHAIHGDKIDRLAA